MATERTLSFVEVAELAEAAAVDQQREVFELAWAAIHGRRPRANRGGNNPENRFVALLNANGFESAAAALVPEGWQFLFGGRLPGRSGGGLYLDGDELQEVADAETFGLAICACAMKVRARDV